MLFKTTITTLKEKLREPLPGIESHRKYSPLGDARLNSKVLDNTRDSAVLILFYPQGNQAYFPLILRPKYDGTHGGQMALPGGKAESNDENLRRTALREAQEEIGIKAIDVNIIGELTNVFIPVSNFNVKPVIGYMDYKPIFYPDAREVEEIIHINLDDVLNKEQVLFRNIMVRDKQMSVPGFELMNKWVWGATSFILSELSDILSVKHA